MITSDNLSSTRIQRIREQGYFTQDNEEIKSLSIGNRFAYQLCTTVAIAGIVLQNVPILLFLSYVAFLSIILPVHPFDLIYNYFLAKPLGRPKLPRRSYQLKFACGIATLCLWLISYFFSNNMIVAGYITSVVFLSSAITVSTTDMCVPSKIYNSLFKIKF